ncbi:DUF3298 domain-containing protein [Ursidibacter sp. B-7004-1]
MKKSLIAMLISSVLILTACEDTNLPQKVFEAEKKIVQLETDFKKSQTDLTATTEELNKLKSEYETLKGEYFTAKTELDKKLDGFPALQVEITPIFNKSETVKHPKDPADEYYREETGVSVFASLATTKVDWLDQLLLKEAFKYVQAENETVPTELTQEIIKERLEKDYSELVAEAKEDRPIGLSYSLESSYFGQRNHIATFTMVQHTYMGGAHGMYSTRYINVDANTKAVIQIDDLISPKNQAQVKELLWQNYRNDRLNEQGQYDGYAKKEDIEISENFYFASEGIYFVYAPYHLGPFAEGEVKILLDWYSANKLINSPYQRTEKDGYGLNPNEM